MIKSAFALLFLFSVILNGQTQTYYYELNKIDINNAKPSEKTIFSWQPTNIQSTQINSVFFDGDKTNFVYTVYSSTHFITELQDAVITWGDEISNKKKELAKYVTPWCGTTQIYFSNTVVAKKVSFGQVIINNLANLSAIISKGQVSQITLKDKSASLGKVFCTFNNKSLFVVKSNDNTTAFYLEELHPDKEIELTAPISMPGNYKPFSGIAISDSLYILSDVACHLFQLTGSTFSKIYTIGSFIPTAFANNNLYYTDQNYLYKSSFDNSMNRFENGKKIRDIGYFTAISNDGKFLSFRLNDSLFVFSFQRDAIVFKSFIKDASQLRAIHMDSTFLYLERHHIGVSVNCGSLPNNYFLNQNYPNPFNPSTVISYKLQAASHVTLKVYDLLGREVATLVDEFQQPGIYNSQFSISRLAGSASESRGRDWRESKRANSQLSSGVYFYQLKAGSFTSTKKMNLLK